MNRSRSARTAWCASTGLSATILMLLLLAAGCGGDAASAPLSADDYRAQADAICAETNAELDKVPDPSSAADIVKRLEQARPIVDTQIARLKDLSPPEDLVSDHMRAIALLEEQLELSGTIATRIDDGEEAFEVVNDVVPKLEDIDARADRAAAGLQLTVCGQGQDA